MTLMAILVFLTLAAIAALHVAWGFGMTFPAASRDDLFHLVVGATRQTEMPTLPQCLAAATAIFLSGATALLVADLVKLPVPSWMVTALGALVTLVFAGRGAAPYTSTWRRRFSKQPFATMDQSWYGPLCLLLAACFATLLIKRVMT
jgi:hypothetical protein